MFIVAGNPINNFTLRADIGTAAFGGSFGQDCYVENCSFKEFSGDGSSFESYVSFRGSKFDRAPSFKNTVFPDSCSFLNATFKDVASKEAEGRYRRLKTAMAEMKNESDEMLFSSLELECRRKRLDLGSNGLEVILSTAYAALNNYGRSISLPLIWLTSMTIAFALFYFEAGNFGVDEPSAKIVKICESTDPASCRDQVVLPESWIVNLARSSPCEQALLYSAVNMLGPLKYAGLSQAFVPKTIWAMWISWLQTLIATILWFLFIVGIRRRFRTG